MQKLLAFAAEGPYLTSGEKEGEIVLIPQHHWSHLPVIIIKDSSISTALPHTLEDVEGRKVSGIRNKIEIALSKATEVDLYFLCRWNDLCDKNENVNLGPSQDPGLELKKSIQPTATQAIMYTPRMRDELRQVLDGLVRSHQTKKKSLGEILNNGVSSGKWRAVVFIPNLVDFDVNLATSVDDFDKLNECARPGYLTKKKTTTTTSTTNTSQIIWIVVAIIIVVLLVLIFLRYSRGNGGT
jgi:hypothetical protein